MKIKAVDLFCGIGGLTCGIQKTGIDVIAGYDIEESCKYAYEYNNHAKFILKDIKDISETEIINLYPKDTDVRILMGCAPCQPFSSYSHRYKETENRNKKLNLLDYFGKQIENVQPDIVSMENVPQLIREDVFSNFLQLLENNNYYISWKIVYAPDYGVPQNRKRLLLLASKLGNIKLIDSIYNKNSYITVRDVISHLPKISAGETHETDFLHSSRKLSELNLKRIQSSKPGGTWKDWDENLLPDCYKRKSGESYSAVYGRLEWDKPSSTITTQFPGYGNGRFGHPEQDRALSLREGAIIQTFPDNYKFIKDKKDLNFSKIATQIGNAVPPKLGEIIGLSIKKHLEEVYHECY